ncbi:thaumatin family protein [Streptacidiphilus sp. EB103A]|uniref:thaumatin family protein n=1 Tax=Streptacidiphilus sp. EB103A TaxID=3156275 RepID=UPI003512ACE6
MARRKKHRTRSGRSWWLALTAAVVAALVIVFWPSPPNGVVITQVADRPTAVATAGAAPTASLAASHAVPSATPSPSRTPSGTPSRTPSPTATAKATHPATAPQPTQAAPAGQRSIALVNSTQQTVWVIVTNTTVAYPGGLKLQPGQSATLTVGNTWGGRIWGRTGCATSGAGTCLTGDCTTTCSGPTTPTTLGEFTFDAFDNLDFYDVSMVDGANLPMYINISHTVTADPITASGCYKGTCTTPIVCPSAMQALNGGQVIGCKPPCAAFGGDTYCCRGAWAGRANCVPAKWPVDYTQVFKKAEPYAYSYAFDDSATMSCKGSCFYRVTFGTTG